MLRAHAIDPDTLRRDDCNGFFQVRTRALLELIEKVMAKAATLELFQEFTQQDQNSNAMDANLIRNLSLNRLLTLE
jgi:hypothetical protein